MTRVSGPWIHAGSVYPRTIVMGVLVDASTETNTYHYEVESIETIAVAAGTLDCFKLVQYDEQGDLVSTSWVSTEAKCIVKKTKDTGETTSELQSYSAA